MEDFEEKGKSNNEEEKAQPTICPKSLVYYRNSDGDLYSTSHTEEQKTNLDLMDKMMEENIKRLGNLDWTR